MWLFSRLAGEEIGCGLSEYEDYGEVLVKRQRLEDVRDFYGRDRAGGGEEQVCLFVVVRGGKEGRAEGWDVGGGGHLEPTRLRGNLGSLGI